MRPAVLRILFVAAMLLSPLYLGAVYLWCFSISAVLLAVSLAADAAFHDANTRTFWHRTGVEPVILGYLLAHIISSVFGLMPYRSAEETFKLAGVILAFIGTVRFCSQRDWTRRLCLGIAVFGGILSFMGLLQYLGALPSGWWHVPGFLSSVYVNHNHFAGLLQILLPISLGAAIAEREAATKALLTFLCACMGVAFILTLSRGGYIALTLALCLMAVLLTRRGVLGRLWPAAAAVGLVAAGGSLFGWQPVESRIRTMTDLAAGDISFQERLRIWSGALNLIRDQLWLGSGPGSFELAFLRYRPEGYGGRPVYAHNDYLNLLADVGLIAAFLATLIVGMVMIKGLKIIHEDDSRFRICVGSGCIAALAALCIHSLSDFNFHIPANWLWSTVPAGILLSMGSRPSQTQAAGDRGVRIGVGILAVGVLAGAFYFGASDLLLWKARMLPFTAASRSGAERYVELSLKTRAFNDVPYYVRGRFWSLEAANESGKPDAAADQAMRAAADFDRAAQINGLEPYYDLQAALSRFEANPADVPGIEARVRSAVQKDGLDPKLLYLAGDLLLKVAPQSAEGQYPELVRYGEELLLESVRLDAKYTEWRWRSLWIREGRPTDIKSFESRIDTDPNAVLWFIEETDQWKYHRSYWMRLMGLDPDRKGVLFASMNWGKPSQEFDLADFENGGSRRPVSGECFFANGELTRRIQLDREPSLIRIRARGSKAGASYPVLIIELDGKPIDSLYISSSVYTDYYTVVSAPRGVHNLTLKFINDFGTSKPSADRNVWVQKVRICPSEGLSHA